MQKKVRMYKSSVRQKQRLANYYTLNNNTNCTLRVYIYCVICFILILYFATLKFKNSCSEKYGIAQ